mmetsp:Transcript_128774/g.372602  ORF Transcript_128774/g.372602 Transcript_128774/m.372602 type:complete len:219 (-) Transcript_128774:220-876(-)|eukprot:CAMPEP_0176093006 /NCGR_PEP_ID=MMETSP0120_2-20121206/46599_1 /TAXON_ID=160619 /ORGANISM="Kryptoperidinium foliaceum, Strain CCMP 1326" /LENGTH=218 /DNA_ID=CAMNT_0017426931 /DNA_START=80 /DNA_END=736 /DNA_ORIENTATION=-
MMDFLWSAITAELLQMCCVGKAERRSSASSQAPRFYDLAHTRRSTGVAVEPICLPIWGSEPAAKLCLLNRPRSFGGEVALNGRPEHRVAQACGKRCPSQPLDQLRRRPGALSDQKLMLAKHLEQMAPVFGMPERPLGMKGGLRRAAWASLTAATSRGWHRLRRGCMLDAASRDRHRSLPWPRGGSSDAVLNHRDARHIALLSAVEAGPQAAAPLGARA